MYIEPNTTIKLYSGIPLDNSYKNTLYFANISAQSSYFHGGISKYTLARQSYQRVERGRMRVELLADNIYDCNYLAFQNENFGNKWFYAFITSVEYVNNTTSEITFEIDVMQTWYFDYELLDSFVDREHTANDTIGANLVEENLELGEYVINGEIETIGYNDFYAVVGVSQVWDSSTRGWRMAMPTIIGGTPQCIKYFCFNIDGSGMDGLQMLLNGYVNDGKIDAILGVFLLPKKAFPTTQQLAPIADFSTPMTINKIITKKYGSFDGYTPRNNKLYTYPYNFLYVTTMNGNSAVYPFEYFDTAYCEFKSTILASTNCEALLEPNQYKGSVAYNRDESISLKGFPQCAFAGDAFRAWLAQNSGSITMGFVQSSVPLLAGIAGAYLPGVAPLVAGGLVASGTISVLNNLGKVRDHSIQPPQTKGVDTSTILSAKGYLDFTFMNKRIRGEFARIIDNFFTMYGYKTNRVKVPNIHARQRWTYTKTIGCNIKGECPTTHLKKIIEIYDNGITFWVNPSEVGNYALSNPTI